jgi:hypothetical protein
MDKIDAVNFETSRYIFSLVVLFAGKALSNKLIQECHSVSTGPILQVSDAAAINTRFTM